MSSGQLISSGVIDRFDERNRRLRDDAIPFIVPHRDERRNVGNAAARTRRATSVAPIRTPRIASVDAGRFIAAAGVVYLHSMQSAISAPFACVVQLAVPFYIVIALVLQAQSFRADPNRSTRAYAFSRVARLYAPFLFWCAMYAIARGAKHAALSGYLVDLSPSVLWGGTQYHLWFVPFLIALSTLAAALHARLARESSTSQLPTVLAIAFALLGVAFCALNAPAEWIADFRDPNYALYQMWRNLPVACWAICLSITIAASRSPRDAHRVESPFWFAGLAALGVAGLIVFQMNQPGVSAAARGLGGLLCAVIVFARWRGRFVESLARLGQYSFGIYLSHVLFVELGHAATRSLNLQPTIATDLVIFAFALASALALTIRLSHRRTLAWIVGN